MVPPKNMPNIYLPLQESNVEVAVRWKTSTTMSGSFIWERSMRVVSWA